MHGTTKQVRRRLRHDLLLVVTLLLLALIGGILYSTLRDVGETVTVTVNGEVYASYPLGQDRTVEIPSGTDGTGRNLLVISAGRAWISEASCPDRICVHHAPILCEGDAIVCLPNRVVVTVGRGEGTK